MTLTLRYCRPFFAAALAFYAQHALAFDLEEVTPGVYAGHTTTQAGEDIYPALELVTENNASKWIQYINHVSQMVGGNSDRGLIQLLAEGHSFPNTQYTGFSDQEYAAYVQKINTRFGGKPEKQAALKGIAAGYVAFKPISNGKTYVAYISKTPVTRTFPFGELEDSITLKRFKEAYDTILMTVGVTSCPGTPFVEKRGIFRNPKSVVDGGYATISKDIDRAIARFATTVLTGKKYLYVQPIPAMSKILQKNFTPDEMFIGTNKTKPEKRGVFSSLIHDDGASKNLMKEGFDPQIKDNEILYTLRPGDIQVAGFLDIPHLIKLEALLKYTHRQ